MSLASPWTNYSIPAFTYSQESTSKKSRSQTPSSVSTFVEAKREENEWQVVKAAPKRKPISFDTFVKKKMATYTPFGITDPTATIVKNNSETIITEKTKQETQYAKKNGREYDAPKMYKVDMADSASRIEKVGIRLGQKIGSERTSQKLSQEELAQKANLTVGVIRSWEKSEAVYDSATMQKISAALGIPLRK